MDATEPHSPVLKGEAGLRPAGFTSPSPSVYAMHASSSSEEGAVHSGDLGPSGAGPGLDAAYERYAFYPGAAMFDDEDEEDEGAEDYDAPRHCVNCTAPLWDDVCLDCGHDDAHTPSLFDPTPLSRRATNSAGPCPANSVDTCLPNASAVAHTAADARPRPRRRDAVTVVAYDDAMLLHQESEACPSSGGGAHPERPERLRAVWARLQAAELAERCVRLPSRPATDAELEAVHSRRLVRGLEALSEGIRRAEECEEEGEETAGFADAHQLSAVGPRGFPAPPPTLGASCDGGPASGVVPEPLLGVPPALTPPPLRLPPDTDAARAHASHWACMASLARALGVAPGVLPDSAGGGALGTLGVLGARAESCPALLAKGAAGGWRDEGGEAGDNLTEGPSSQGDADALSTPAAPACLGARPPSPDASLLHEEDDVIAANEALDPHAGEPRDAQQVEPRDAQEVKLVDVSAPRGAKPPRDVPAAARLFAASPNRAWSAAGLPSPPGHPIPSHRPPGAVHPAKRKFSECGPA
ncbi:HDA3 [Auxenochlorella protothecoides x Auxenochlorella symbiontica]